MKLQALFLAAALALGTAACTSETVSHDASQLPSKAQEFISQNFTSAISVVEKDKNLGKTSEYEVTLTDGSQIEFNSSGEWKSVDTPNNVPVPAGIVPTNIAQYVAQNHQGAYIVGIEKNKKGYEIELSNGMDMQFGPAGNFLNYDN